MAEKTPKLDDDQIVAILDYGIGQSVGFSESKLSKERERVQLYYDGVRPRKQGAGDSGYNSMDVFDGVEDMHAQLLETFSANKRPVKFDAAPHEPPLAAKYRTDYVTEVLFRQNPGYLLFGDTIRAGLMSRNSVVKVWWDVQEKPVYVHLSEPSFEEIQSYFVQHGDEKPEVTDTILKEDGVAIKRVTVRLMKDVSQCRIELLGGESFGISPMAESIEKASLVFDRQPKTYSELIKAGYPKAKVELLQSDDRLWTESDQIVRFTPTDDMIGDRSFEDGQTANRTVLVYECYVKLDLEDEGVSQLFKVTKVGNTILDKEPVERKPYVSFCPLPRPKAFWGVNFADLLIATQNARTYLTRSIIRHTLHTNNPKTLVERNALMNPKELTESRYGGIVNVSRITGIAPIRQGSLNPFVFQTIQMLKSDKEEKIGISALSQGLDKDAVSKQNSGDMIHELITVSQLRQKVVARNFAENFLAALYNAIYLLVLENEDRAKMVRVSGGWAPVDFSQWPETCSVSVSFALGYGEQDKEAAKWASVHKGLSGMPALAGQYGPAQQYEVAHSGLEALGIEDIDRVLLPPNKAAQVPPDPLHQAEIAMKNADAKMKEAQAQVSVANVQFERDKLASSERIEMARIQLAMKKLDNEIRLKQDQLAHKVSVDAAEIALQQVAQRSDKLNAEAIPTR